MSEYVADDQPEAEEKRSGGEDSEPSDSAPLSKLYKISPTIKSPTPSSKTPSQSPSHSPTPQRAQSPDLTRSPTSSPIRNSPSPHHSTEPALETEPDQTPKPTDEEPTESIHLNTHIRFPSETPSPTPSPSPFSEHESNPSSPLSPKKTNPTPPPRSSMEQVILNKIDNYLLAKFYELRIRYGNM